MKRFRKMLIALAVVVIPVTVWLSVVHFRAKAAVNAYREQLKKRGEKTTVAELTPVLSADEVAGGKDLLAAMKAAGKFTNTPRMMRWIAPGHALVGWSEAISLTDNVTNCWPELTEILNKHSEVGERLIAVVQRPGIGFDMEYQQGWAASISDPEAVREAGFWLAQCMMLALHEGDTNRAWNYLLGEITLIAKYRGELLEWSQGRRNDMVKLAVVSTWEALQYPGWDENHLAQLQTNWASVDIMGRAEAAISMEGAMMSILIDASRTATNFYSGYGSEELDVDKLLVSPKEEFSNYFAPRLAYRAWVWRESYHTDLFQMQATQAALEALRTARSNDAILPALSAFYQTITQMSTNYSPREIQFMNDWGNANGFNGYLSGCAEAETERRIVTTVLALKRYRLRHGEYPARLEDLTPDLMAKVPIDFMDGRPLRYRRGDDGTFLLYSIGSDGRDDGGEMPAVPTASSVYRRWEQMPDIVWPMPATEAEVKKYEAEMLQKYLEKEAAKRRPAPKPAPAQPSTTKTN